MDGETVPVAASSATPGSLAGVTTRALTSEVVTTAPFSVSFAVPRPLLIALFAVPKAPFSVSFAKALIKLALPTPVVITGAGGGCTLATWRGSSWRAA